jgi:1,4-alpha-glucan branching enzyme
MGGEFGQSREWNHDASLDWHLCQYPDHEGIRLLVRDLNRLYVSEPVLSENDFNPRGFQWISCHDGDASVISYLRSDPNERTFYAVVGHFSGATRSYRVGLPRPGMWREIINTNSEFYAGNGLGNEGGRVTENISSDGHAQSVAVTLAPFTTVIFKWSAP